MKIFKIEGYPTPSDIGKVVYLKVPLKRWLRYWLGRLINKPVDRPGMFIITDVKKAAFNIEPAYQCHACKQAVSWTHGAADGYPFICDDCWAEMMKHPKAHT